MISAPAADRNKEPILQVLTEVLGDKATCPLRALEIASGSGQHVAHFAAAFPSITWTPSDVDRRYFSSIAAYSASLPNVTEALFIDITSAVENWPDEVKGTKYDLIYCANMIHISPFETTVGLFNSSGLLLKSPSKGEGDGLLITYGPYAECGLLEPESNVRFDEGLRAQNPQWGVRDIDDLVNIAKENGIRLVKRFDMPANNKTLVWQKE